MLMLSITVSAVFLDEQSIPEENIYIWAYHIKIVNNYDHTVIIKKRFFEVVDLLGQRHVVEEGLGMVNKESSITADHTFEYVSGVVLDQPSGFFNGFFVVEETPGVLIQADVPSFSLDSKYNKSTTQ